jgi:hypothetical protein
MARVFWALLSVLIVITATGCGNFKSQTKIVRAADSASEAVELGDTGRVDNFAVTVIGVRATNARDGVVKDVPIRVPDPAEGYVYILINVSVENVGDEFEVISSRQQINLFDGDHKTQKWSLVPISKGAIDGRIDPGRERHGELVWEVREDASDLKLVFGETVFAIGDASGFRPGSSEQAALTG